MIDRLSPFPADLVFFGVQVVALDRERRNAHVEVALTPRARAQSAIAKLVEQGLFPVRVVASVADLKLPFVFDDAAPPDVFTRSERFARWSTIAAFILIALGVPIVVFVTEQRAQALEEEAKLLRPAAERVRTLSDEVVARRKSQQEWRAFAEAPRISDVLETLTERVDDGAWIFAVEYDRQGLTLHGLAHEVPALLGRLSAPPFGTGALAGAIVSGSAHEGDRFDVKLPILETAR